MATASMTDDLLQTDIDRLIELDHFRTQFATWRDRGREALRDFVKGRRSHTASSRWLQHRLRHDAQVVKALCHRGDDDASFKSVLDELRAMKAKDILRTPSPHEGELNLLDAAYSLDALASAPGAALSPATMYFFYVVVREMYYPTPPVWIVGGARAGDGGQPTAFATSQFVRAISSFARMLQRTGEYFSALAELPYTRRTDSDAWNQQDAKRRALSLYISLHQRSWNLAIDIEHAAPETIYTSDPVRFEAQVRDEIIASLKKTRAMFMTVRKDVEACRAEERKLATEPQHKHVLDRSEGAHAVALRTLNDGVERLQQALESFSKRRSKYGSEQSRREFVVELGKLSQLFGTTADAVRKLTRPALDYLSAVLDTQLARAMSDSGSTSFEPSEMAAAAATLGAAGHEWDDERLVRAAQLLTNSMGREGFAISMPFHTAGGVSFYQPSQQHIIASYAQILEHVTTDLPAGVIARISRYFDKTRSDLDESSTAWRWAYADPSRRQYSAAQTAISAIALDRLCRMLDSRINGIVLKHFNTKKPALRLQDLFYPDYGLATILDERKDAHRVPVAIALERMRAHIVNVPLAEPHAERLYSAVFHGPPGTGKTTLLEALAASAEVPFVEVTPSDIVVHGTDAVERRARAVLRALSFLTRAVVIFDEFDSVLQTRITPDGREAPPSMLTFLTPNMLPKLKTLYDAAKERHVAFALATNVHKKLDPAAIRSGRFDAHIGVYPPDAVSRYGRLFNEVHRYLDDTGTPPPDDLQHRFHEAVQKSRGWSMQDAARPGWFTRPRGKVRAETLFGYLFGDGALVDLSSSDDEKTKDLWSPKELADWDSIESLEASGNDLGRAIWESTAKAFPGRISIAKATPRSRSKPRRPASRRSARGTKP